MERKRRFQTRQQYAEQKAQSTKFEKFNKNLNYLIALVAVLIVATLIFIITKDPQPKNEAKTSANNEQVVNNEEKPANNEPNNTAEEKVAEGEDAQGEGEQSPESTIEAGENTVIPSDDPAVKEVQTNAAWPAYPTQQTGTHVSVYEKGNIDYEEKLKAFFSVLDLQQENSIILSVKSNGSTTASTAVITSMDKEQKYRVSIEWIDGEGWKPTRLEVLNTVEGTY